MKKSTISFILVLILKVMITVPQSSFAANELKLAYQYGTVVENFSMPIDETTDLCFLGAPSHWRSLHPTWYSSDTSVAEVDSSGVVTAKSTGMAIIFLVLDNGMTGSTTVYVKEKEPEAITIPSKSEQAITFSITKAEENSLLLTFSSLDTITELQKNNFEIIESYASPYGEYQQPWNISSIQTDKEKRMVLITGCDKLSKDFTYTVNYLDSNSEEVKILASASFTNHVLSEETPTRTQIVLQNQEAIHIPANATFADGTPIQNVRDIAKYAFSYRTSDGTPVVPTYEANATGISDIVKVTYRTNKGANAVIIQKVYLKVYLDPNHDNWVTAAEKAEDALGYYLMEVDVDKTLTIEDWTIVTD